MSRSLIYRVRFMLEIRDLPVRLIGRLMLNLLPGVLYWLT